MAKKGDETRVRIMDAAQAMILDNGYGGTSVDQVIRSLGLTKGAFFHHFSSKSDLAKALIQRWADNGIALFQRVLERSTKLSDDPLQQLLILVGLYKEMFEDIEEPYAGCLMASYVYELRQFDEEVQPIINLEMLHWRKALTVQIDRIKLRYPARVEIDSVALADSFLAIFEGAFIISKSLKEPQVTAQQLGVYKSLIEALFKP